MCVCSSAQTLTELCLSEAAKLHTLLRKTFSVLFSPLLSSMFPRHLSEIQPKSNQQKFYKFFALVVIIKTLMTRTKMELCASKTNIPNNPKTTQQQRIALFKRRMFCHRIYNFCKSYKAVILRSTTNKQNAGAQK